jgi:predicted  nucleic acid-binding Zn-ribbon protein
LAAPRLPARLLLNQTLAAAVQRLGEQIVRHQQALSRATSEDAHAALAAEYETLLGSRVAAEQQLAASQDAELHERWRDITALQTLAAHADRATRITLDMQLAELRDLYAVAKQARSTTTRPVMNAEPAPRIIPLGA